MLEQLFEKAAPYAVGVGAAGADALAALGFILAGGIIFPGDVAPRPYDPLAGPGSGEDAICRPKARPYRDVPEDFDREKEDKEARERDKVDREERRRKLVECSERIENCHKVYGMDQLDELSDCIGPDCK